MPLNPVLSRHEWWQLKGSMTSKIRVAGLLLFGVAIAWLVKTCIRPGGSDNMFVATDHTPVQAIVVCSDTGEVLWRIVSRKDGGREPESIPYGTVPEGFAQDIPPTGRPRPFVVGEYLQVHVFSATKDMGDAGTAVGPAEFRSGAWFGGPRLAKVEDLDCRPPGAKP